MKNSKILFRTAAIALLVGTSLAGCIAVPVYDAPRAYGPVIAPAVVVGPDYRPYYGGGYGGPRGHYW